MAELESDNLDPLGMVASSLTFCNENYTVDDFSSHCYSQFKSFGKSKNNTKERKCFFDHTIDKFRTMNFEEIRAFFCKERDLFANFDMVNYRLVTYEKRYPVCSSSKILLRRINLDQHLVPLKCLADDNCLFRAVSLFLYGNDSFHLELIVRCILEIALNTDKYMDNRSLLAQLKTKPNSKNSDRFIEWISLFCGTNISGSINDLLKEEIMRLIEVDSWASLPQ